MSSKWVDDHGKLADEPACVEAAVGGDQEALVVLIQHCERQIASAVFSAGTFLTFHDREDASQESLLRITLSIGTFRRESGICSWMFSVARHTTRNLARTMRRRNTHPYSQEDISELLGARDGSEEKVTNQLLAQLVLASLPDELRETVVLKYIGGLTDQEIAVRQFIDADTVRSRISAVRKRIRGIIKGGRTGDA